MLSQISPWRQSVSRTLPVMLGYIPLGIAFGVLAVQMNHPIWLVGLMSLVLYSGAGQFLMLGLLAAHASLANIFVAMFLLSSRHIFYGLSLLNRFYNSGWRKPYLIHALTDETYSLLSSDPKRDIDSDWRISLLNQFWWFSGSMIGALIGSAFTFDSTGMEFALTALFIVLTVELACSLKDTKPFAVGLGCALLSLMLIAKDYMLLASIGGACVVLLLEYNLKRAQSGI